MSDTQYSLVTKGELVAGAALEDTRQRLCALFKKSDAEMAVFLSKKTVTIKGKVDYETARRYQKVIERAGLLSIIKEAATDDAKGRHPIGVLAAETGKIILQATPHQCNRLSAWEGGIRLSRAQLQQIEFAAIEMVSVYRDASDEFCLVFFIADHTRPYEIKASGVTFSGFAFENDISLAGTLIRFVHFLMAKNPAMVMDQKTRCFLETKKAITVDTDEDRYYSSLYRALKLHMVVSYYYPDSQTPDTPVPTAEAYAGNPSAKAAVQDDRRPRDMACPVKPVSSQNTRLQAQGRVVLPSKPVPMDKVPAKSPPAPASVRIPVENVASPPTHLSPNGKRLAFPVYSKVAGVSSLFLLPLGFPISFVAFICFLAFYYLCFMWQEHRGEVLFYAFFTGGSILVLVPFALVTMGLFKSIYYIFQQAMGKWVQDPA